MSRHYLLNGSCCWMCEKSMVDYSIKPRKKGRPSLNYGPGYCVACQKKRKKRRAL